MEALLGSEDVAALRAAGDDAGEACTAACTLLATTGGSAGSKRPGAASPAADAAALIFVEATRRQLSVAHFADDVAVYGTGFPPNVREALVTAWKAHRAALVAAHDGAGHGTQLSRLTGVQWALRHQLGDKTSAPDVPARSLPAYEITLQATGGDVTFQLTAEKAQDMLASLRDAVAAADRITKKA